MDIFKEVHAAVNVKEMCEAIALESFSMERDQMTDYIYLYGKCAFCGHTIRGALFTGMMDRIDLRREGGIPGMVKRISEVMSNVPCCASRVRRLKYLEEIKKHQALEPEPFRHEPILQRKKPRVLRND